MQSLADVVSQRLAHFYGATAAQSAVCYGLPRNSVNGNSRRSAPILVMQPATVRFGDRVADYLRSRPGYPAELLDVLVRHCGFGPSSVVADVGAGTGLLTRLFLDAGNPVFAVEPNREMRTAFEAAYPQSSTLTSVDGRAEATTLPDASIDLVAAAQAFHWFDRPLARAEFARILEPGGWVALIWNDRRLDATPFLRGYEDLLIRLCPEYLRVVHRNVGQQALSAFFAPCAFEQVVLDNRQVFDWDGLVSRHLSSSFVPNNGPERDLNLSALRSLFDATAVGGKVEFEYDTRIHLGRLHC